MLPSKNSFLDHVKWLRKAVAAEQAEFILAGDSMQALVRKGNMHWRLRPQFLITIDGTRQYSSTPSDGPQMFAGWFPYETRRWRLASDKLAFKHFAQSAGFQVPDHDVSPTSQMTDVVVKRVASSFGTQVSGPYRTAQEHTIDPSTGEYYERFIFGDLVKIWFWNAEPICAEVDRMPYVMGDGVLNLRQQIIVRARYARNYSDEESRELVKSCAPLLKYYGVTEDTILPRGKEQRIEFRYGSDLMHPRNRRIVDLQSDPLESWAQPIPEIGKTLYGAIPGDLRQHVVYTVDAIRDPAGKLWLLEMNSNPTLHPLVYVPMMRDLLSNAAQPSVQDLSRVTSSLEPAQA